MNSTQAPERAYSSREEISSYGPPSAQGSELVRRPPSAPVPLPPSASSALIETGWSESVQSVLEQPPAALPRYLILAGLAFATFFGIWAWAGRIEEVSHAKGEIIPRGRTFKLQPATDGEIDRVLVKEGDRVKAGELLFELDPTLLEGDIVRLQQTLAADKEELTQVRLLVEKNRLEALAQQQIALANIEAQQAALAQARANRQTQQTLLTTADGEFAAHQERLNRISALEAQGAISKEYLFELEQGVRDQQQKIIQTQGGLDQAQAQIQQLEAEVSQKQAEAEQSQLTAQQSLQKLLMQAQELQAAITDTQTQLAQAQARLAQSQVRAPVNGMVSSLTVEKPGEYAQPGQTLAEIVPEGTPLVLSAIIPQAEAGLLETGMTSQIKFDAFPYQTYGILSGKVIAISPDAKGNAENGVGYQVEIALDRDYVIHEQARVPLKIGQTANAEIVVRRRRILDLILDPIRRLRADDLSL